MTRMTHKLLTCLAATTLIAAPSQLMAEDHALQLFIGTFSRDGSEGIHTTTFDPATGALGELRLAAKSGSAGWIAFSSDGERVYSIAPPDGDDPSGRVIAYSVNHEDATLTPIGDASVGGQGPAFVATHPEAPAVFVANYGGGSVSSLPLADDGSPLPPQNVIEHEGSGPHPRQQAPHAHQALVSPGGGYLLVADLGIDQVHVYRIDSETGALEANDPSHFETEAGAGPRHCAFHPEGGFVYALGELDAYVYAYSWDEATGKAEFIDRVPGLTPDFEGDFKSAQILVHPNGRFLYTSNRGPDDIAIFAIDPESGVPELVEHHSSGGKTPRNFTLSPDGSFLIVANKESGDIHVFAINQEDGTLSATGHHVELPWAVCLVFPPEMP